MLLQIKAGLGKFLVFIGTRMGKLILKSNQLVLQKETPLGILNLVQIGHTFINLQIGHTFLKKYLE